MTEETQQRFAANWRAAGAPRRILLAVSGGSDSMALMHLASALGAAGADILVATVDHNLRPGSASEADFVRQEATALGLEAVTLVWEGPKPKSAIQAAARAARYRLLAAEAERIGADAVMTAHTVDDQAETLLMRIARRTGAKGLAGIAAETWVAAGAGRLQRLLRPLLGESRARLRACLSAIGARYVDDPSNDDRRYERVRLRQHLAKAPDREAIVADLGSLAKKAQTLQACVRRLEALQFAFSGGEFLADGSVRIAGVPAAGLLASLIHAVGGEEHAPHPAPTADALASLSDNHRTTLGGCLLERKDGVFVIRREPGAVLGRHGGAALATATLSPSERQLWDRRFAVHNIWRDAVDVRPVGPWARSVALAGLPGLETSPGIFKNGKLTAFPGDHGEGDAALKSLVGERFALDPLRF